jgi:hypothetical protein
VLELVKSLLAGRKVVVYGGSSSAVATFMLSVLSLLPGQILFNFCPDSLRAYLWELRDLGLPLRLFT